MWIDKFCYTVQVTDAVGCIVSKNVTVNNNDGPAIDEITTTSSYCGLARGKAQAAISGGTPPYTYEWVGDNYYQTGDSATYMSQGDYSLMVTDATGCKSASAFQILDDHSLEPSIEIVSKYKSACDQNYGSASVAMSGGLPPYSYQWDDPENQKSVLAENLHSGIYHVTGTDAKGCEVMLEVTIEDEPDPVLSFEEKTASACDKSIGTATVSASGGLAPYTYLWDDPLQQTGAKATDLSKGIYTVMAFDSHGCQTNALQVEIDEVDPLQIYLTELKNVSCAGGADGYAKVDAAGGVPPYTFVTDGRPWQEETVIENLSEGQRDIYVRDANGCNAFLSLEIAGPPELTITSISSTDPVCFGDCNGQIIVNATGGTQPYTYLWSNGSTTKDLEGLCAGDYTLTITDANSCSVSGTIHMGEPDPVPSPDIPEKVVICEGNSIAIDGGEYSEYNWTSTSNFNSNNRVVNIYVPGTYYLDVKNEKGCTATDTLSLEISNDILQAKALISSEAFVGDTVEIIDVSWPVSDSISWSVPPGVELVSQQSDRIHLVFSEEGDYIVGLNAYSGLCADYVEYQIEILKSGDIEDTSGSRLGYNKIIKSVTLYPNPNDGTFQVHIELTRKEAVNTKLIDMVREKVVKETTSEHNSAYDLLFSAPELPSGVYILSVEVGGEIRNVRLVVR